MTARDLDYWARVRRAAKALDSDGCTGVPDIHLDCCYEHDIAYSTGCDVNLEPLTRRQADADFRRCLQARSWLGVFSPMAWWRWAAVRVCGRGIWAKK